MEVETNLDRRRRERSEPGATSPRRMVMRHGGGHGVRARRFPRKTQTGTSTGKADRTGSAGRGQRSRGAESLGGETARRLKQADRGYMAPYLCCRHSQGSFVIRRLPLASVNPGMSLRQRMLPPRGRSGTGRPAQRHQHGSMTKPQVF